MIQTGTGSGIDVKVTCKNILRGTDGFEHGFEMIVPANTNSTFDNEFMSAEITYHYYNEHIWNKRYAHCVSFEQTLELMKQQTESEKK